MKKTQYILNLKDSKRSAVVDDPGIIFYCRAYGCEETQPNLVSVYFLFSQSKSKTDVEIEEECYRTNSYPIELFDFEYQSWDEIAFMAQECAKKELDSMILYNKGSEEDILALRYFESDVD